MDFKIIYLGKHISEGDYDSFMFKIIGDNSDREKRFEVRISGSFSAIHSNLQLEQIAASGVKSHIQGNVPEDCYNNIERTSMKISTYWYPGIPKSPNKIKNFSEFIVSPKKRNLGFDLK